MLRQKLRENTALWFTLAVILMLLVLVVVGGGATYALRLPIEGAVREEAVRDVVTEVGPRILKMVGPQDLDSP